MHISKMSAMYIVDEISEIIGEKINLMNELGIIIASSDEGRIGSYHQAAKVLVDKNLQEIIVNNETEYMGAKPGLNLAINFRNKIVGVIGVTGPYEVVEKYGKIIKKMTEILLLDQFYKEEKEMDKRIKEKYMDEWMFGNPNNITSEFVKEGISLNIDITIPRRILVVNYTLKKQRNAVEQQLIMNGCYKLIREIMRGYREVIVHKDASELIIGVYECDDYEMLRIAEHIKIEMESKYEIQVSCGIDTQFEGFDKIHSNVIKAMKACNTSMRSPSKGIRFYGSITMEIFQAELSTVVKKEYIYRIFKGCSHEEIQQWIGVLSVFYEEEGSIALAASRLYIHKNTLQYKLNKIKERTGYDPRSIRFSSLFYNAIHFYQDIKEELIL